ncbi:hypothetical protein Tco_0633818 [Tanacetum coccineum]
MIKDMDFIMKYMLETILHQQEIQQLLNEKKLQTQEVQSNTVQELKVDPIVMENTCSRKEISNSQTASSKSERASIEHGFKRAFMSLFGQDADFTSTMLLNVDQLQKQLDKDKFQEDGSLAAFWVVNKQFQKFIDSQFSLNYDSQMTNKSGNDTDTDDADIRPIYDEEPMAEVQLTAECNVFATGQQHTEQPEIITEGRVD